MSGAAPVEELAPQDGTPDGGATTVVWVTCAELPDGDPDDHLALPALASAGLRVRYLSWDDPTAWQDPEVRSALVVVRSAWDYTSRRSEFLAWAASVPHLANPAEVIAWNTDKVYLDELAEAGLPVVPTRTVRPGQDAAEAVTAAFDVATEVVVKPTVSAGSKDTRRHGGAAAALTHAAELLDAGRAVLVQPYLDGVDTLGETGMVVLDGEVSHAFRKGQLLHADAEATDGLYAEEDITATTATAEQLEVARVVTDFLRRRFPQHAPLLYARVDTVPGPDGTPLLLELELTEPSLWLVADPGAAQQWAQAHRRRLRTLTG
ncbi:ATP-grasp domain-containing protein [Aquipuribacter sp. MA13-6]|uniref:ATP-grasp domain-containing protein n=1 Tax=unclassified Aquipuribacter TaxID=2635084 RepID=UPI003EE99F00